MATFADTVKIHKKGETLMVAHRGASGLKCENTLAAFVEAGRRSYFGIECDIHVTADGKFVVFHDDTTGRLCDVDARIENSAFDSLRSLEIKCDGASEPHKMPTLEEYLDVAARFGKVAVIEIKNRMAFDDIARVIEICGARYSLDKIIFISFEFDNLVDVRRVAPNQRVQFLTGEWDDALVNRLAEHRFDLDIVYPRLTKERVAKLHEAGVSVNCWTCDNPADAERLVGYGVDFITTNILE